jgi:hypothetical protein
MISSDRIARSPESGERARGSVRALSRFALVWSLVPHATWVLAIKNDKTTVASSQCFWSLLAGASLSTATRLCPQAALSVGADRL